MKKIVVLGMFVGLLSPVVARADETEVSTKMTESGSAVTSSESSSSQQGTTESTSPLISSEKLAEAKKVEAVKKEPDETKAEPTLVDLTKMVVVFKKGAPITEAEFYQVAKAAPVMKQDGVKSFTFVEGQTVSTATIGEYLDSVKLLGTTTTGEVRVYAMSYIVENNIATLTLSNISYDEKTGVISGKTIPGAYLTITDDLTKERIKMDGTADQNGYFELKGTFEPGSIWYIQAIDANDLHGNFSEVVTFVIPTKEKPTASSSSSEEKKSATPTGNSKNNSKKLPQTGTTTHSSLILMGSALLALVGFGFIKVKMAKNH